MELRYVRGYLPDRKYSEVKKGRLDWPPAARVLEYFHSMARGWLAAGADKGRISMRNIDWTPEEDDYLLEHAGRMTLQGIAGALGRSYAATRARLNKKYGIQSRHNQGFLSAAELAKEYACPYHRVRSALANGDIPGRYDRRRNRWEVQLDRLDDAATAILTQPKLKSYKNSPPDLGDYYQRYGLIRRVVDGKTVAVEALA